MQTLDHERDRAIEELMRRLARTEARLVAAEQNLSKLWGNMPAPASVPQAAFWTIIPVGGVAAATGTWDAITPQTFSGDIYSDVGGTLTLVVASATVRWFYKDSETVGKLVAVASNGDGTYDAIVPSCTRVDV